MLSSVRLRLLLIVLALVAGVMLGQAARHRTSPPLAAQLCLGILVGEGEPGFCVPLP